MNQATSNALAALTTTLVAEAVSHEAEATRLRAFAKALGGAAEAQTGPDLWPLASSLFGPVHQKRSEVADRLSSKGLSKLGKARLAGKEIRDLIRSFVGERPVSVGEVAAYLRSQRPGTSRKLVHGVMSRMNAEGEFTVTGTRNRYRYSRRGG